MRQTDLERDKCETCECELGSHYLWCPVAAGEAVEAAEEEVGGIFYSGMPAGTVH